MKKLRIEVHPNGRYVIQHADPQIIELVDAEGQPIEHKSRFTLCGCGRSKGKPLCDGSHKEGQ